MRLRVVVVALALFSTSSVATLFARQSDAENTTVSQCSDACLNSTDADSARAQCADIDHATHFVDSLICGCSAANGAMARVLQCEKSCGEDVAEAIKLCDLIRSANRSSCPVDEEGSAFRSGEMPSAVTMAIALLLAGSAAVAVL